MSKHIIIKDWSNKHNYFVYDKQMKPLGYVHQEAPTEWKSYNAAGEFIDWFNSKKSAIQGLAGRA